MQPSHVQVIPLMLNFIDIKKNRMLTNTSPIGKTVGKDVGCGDTVCYRFPVPWTGYGSNTKHVNGCAGAY